MRIYVVEFTLFAGKVSAKPRRDKGNKHSRCSCGTSSLTRTGQAVNVLSADFADSLRSLREILLKEQALVLLAGQTRVASRLSRGDKGDKHSRCSCGTSSLTRSGHTRVARGTIRTISLGVLCAFFASLA